MQIRYGAGLFFDYFARKNGEWLTKGHDEIGLALTNEVSLHGWVYHYGMLNVKDVKHLSDDQKQKIISSLDGWCVQIPWGSLLYRFPFSVKKEFTRYLLQVMIEKDIVTKMYDNPFWYLDGKKGPDDEVGDRTFGPRLKYLLDRFVDGMCAFQPCSHWRLSDPPAARPSASSRYFGGQIADFNPLHASGWDVADPSDASLWRSDTSRMANGVQPCQARSLVLGKYHVERRERQVKQWAADFIASEPACWLLRPDKRNPDEDRLQSLIDIYRWASEKWATISSLRGSFEFHRLPDVGKNFNKESGLVKRVDGWVPACGDESAEGMPILMVVSVGIRRQWSDPDQGDQWAACAKASVLAQERTMSDMTRIS